MKKELLIEFRKNCYKNARALYSEAKILFDNKKWARAFFLCIIAFEELGKFFFVDIAIILTLGDEKINKKKFLKFICSHKEKTKYLMQMEGLICSIYREIDVTDDDKIYTLHSKIMDKAKQQSLYSEIFDNKVSLPIKSVPKLLAKEALILLSKRLKMTQYFEKCYSIDLDTIDTLKKEDYIKFSKEHGIDFERYFNYLKNFFK